MNIMDALLQTEESKLKRPTKEVEIKRLTELFAKDKEDKFIVVCEALSHEKFKEIQDMTVTVVNDEKVDVDMEKASMLTVIEAVKNKEGKQLFKDKELIKHFNAHTPSALIKKILLTGEITKLYEVISNLSGHGKDAIAEIKN